MLFEKQTKMHSLRNPETHVLTSNSVIAVWLFLVITLYVGAAITQ